MTPPVFFYVIVTRLITEASMFVFAFDPGSPAIDEGFRIRPASVANVHLVKQPNNTY